MKRRRLNTKSNLYSYLKSSGVLENGTHEEIQKVKKEYWKQYKKKWRNNKRRQDKEIAVSFSKDEFREITTESKRHKLSRTQFIKQSCFAYLNKSFIVPDIKEVRKISQLLSLTYNSIQELIEENKVENKVARTLMDSIYNLEREILPVLNNPKSLEVFIKEHISKNPKGKPKLIEFINSL
ncbi:MAG: hypothetical protein IPI45_13595 [Saprospiraceae bacterium]|nr:hypothetical protein [Saprospiraceae bacterium]MBK7738801.1 hypothetical protein [Saprospiraceae bacterium]MBK7912627.1 hypothetical protein [Saprospiraceae bacterium]